MKVDVIGIAYIVVVVLFCFATLTQRGCVFSLSIDGKEHTIVLRRGVD